LGNWFLDQTGNYPIGGDGYRTYKGTPFSIEFIVRSDHTPRKLFGDALTTCLKNSLHINVLESVKASGGAKIYYMDQKQGHMYTGGWGLTSDPDTLYYLYHINNYYHPGRPNNYYYCPGDYATLTVPVNPAHPLPSDPHYNDPYWQYNNTNVPGGTIFSVSWAGQYGTPVYNLDFSDTPTTNPATYKLWKRGDVVWVNPQNYWAWEMMIGTSLARSVFAAHKSEETLNYFAYTEALYAAKSYTAFYRTYTGPEPEYHLKPWKGVVNQKSFGVWSTRSFLDMHTAGDEFGDGNMTIRWAFRQPTLSLNPIYAEWVWDWYVLNQCYDSATGTDAYVPANDIGDLATTWEVSTWNSGALGLGTCTKVTFHLRHDVYWSDGVPLTSADVAFSWGGHKVAANASIASLLDATGNPPPYWNGQIADMLSVATPDPWTVIVYLDVYAFFGLHSMSGWNIILPEHIWRPFITNPQQTHSTCPP
jgi:hypothetical protein